MPPDRGHPAYAISRAIVAVKRDDDHPAYSDHQNNFLARLLLAIEIGGFVVQHAYGVLGFWLCPRADRRCAFLLVASRFSGTLCLRDL